MKSGSLGFLLTPLVELVSGSIFVVASTLETGSLENPLLPHANFFSTIALNLGAVSVPEVRSPFTFVCHLLLVIKHEAKAMPGSILHSAFVEVSILPSHGAEASDHASVKLTLPDLA